MKRFIQGLDRGQSVAELPLLKAERQRYALIVFRQGCLQVEFDRLRQDQICKKTSSALLTESPFECICTYMCKKQNRTSPDEALNMALCTCANIRKAARIVTQMYETALQQTGLKAGQVTMLAVLKKMGDMPLTALANALVMDRTTLTRNLKPLVRDGLISIETEEDQRVRMVGLTSKGAKKIKEAYPLWAEAQSRLVDGLGSERWSGLVADLNAAVDVARKG